MLLGRFMDIPDMCDCKMPEYTAIFGTPALTRLYVMGGIPLISTCMGSAAVCSHPPACVDRQSTVIRLHVRNILQYSKPYWQTNEGNGAVEDE